MGMRESLDRLLQPIWRRLRLIVSRGVVNRSDDARKLQGLQVSLLADETALMERFQDYGFTSRPQDGAEAIALAVGGARGHLVAIAVDDRRYRMTDLKNGEVAIYTDEGDVIHFKRGRNIEITAGAKVTVNAPAVEANCETATVTASTKARLVTPLTEVTGNLKVLGQIIGQGGMAISGGSGASVDGDMQINNGDVKADDISLKHHLTSGVQPGSGQSGEPV